MVIGEFSLVGLVDFVSRANKMSEYISAPIKWNGLNFSSNFEQNLTDFGKVF